MMRRHAESLRRWRKRAGGGTWGPSRYGVESLHTGNLPVCLVRWSTLLCDSCRPNGSVMMSTAASTASRLCSGSPIPCISALPLVSSDERSLHTPQ